MQNAGVSGSYDPRLAYERISLLLKSLLNYYCYDYYYYDYDDYYSYC